MPDRLRLPEELLDIMRTGEVVLFLGAGATRDAGGPTGSDLAKLLADAFGVADIPTDDLTRFADILSGLPKVDRGDVDARIVASLKDLQPTAAHRLIPMFAWRGLFTTNYDRLIEVAYDVATDGAGRRLQDLKVILTAGDVPPALDPRIVPLFKLHGCIGALSARTPLVLNTTDYDRTRKARARMLRFLRGLAKRHSILFIGYSFSDGVVLELFDQLAREAPHGQMRRMFAVDKSFSATMAEYLQSRNVVPIQATFSAFFDGISAALDADARKACLVRNIDHVTGTDSRAVDLPYRVLLALSNQVEQLGPSVQGPEDARRFLSGQPPLPGDLKKRNDIERDRENSLMSVVRGRLASTDYLRPFIAVLGSGGTGKTTITSRAAYNLVERGEVLAFRLKGEELWNREDLIELCRRAQCPVIFVVDGLEVLNRHKAVKELRSSLSQARVAATLLVSCQKAVWNGWQRTHALTEVTLFEISERLSDSEAAALVRKLTDAGLVNPRSAKDVKELVAAVTEGADGSLIVSMLEMVRGGRFGEIVLNEYEHLTAEAKQAYRFVALLHQHGLSVPDYLLNAVTVKDWSLFEREVIRLDAELTLVQDVSSTARRLFFRTRHPALARIIVDTTVPKHEDRVRMYRALISNVSTSYEDKAFTLRLLTSPAVRDEIGEAPAISEFFDIALAQFPDDQQFLLYLGKFETYRHKFQRAHEILEWARSLNPRNSYIVHQLGVFFEERGKSVAESAVRDGAYVEALKWFRQKQELDPTSHYGYSSEARLHLRMMRDGEKEGRSADLRLDALSAATDAIRRGLAVVRPDDIGPLKEREAEVLGALGDPLKVLRAIDSELQASGGSLRYASTHHVRVICLAQLGRIDDAVSAAEFGLERHPKDERLLAAVLDHLEPRLHLAKCQEWAKRLLAQVPEKSTSSVRAAFVGAVLAYYHNDFARSRVQFDELRESLVNRAPARIRIRLMDSNGIESRIEGLCTVVNSRPMMRALDSGLRFPVDETTWIKNGRPSGEVTYSLGFSFAGMRAMDPLTNTKEP